MKKRLLTVQGPLQFITGHIAHTWQAPRTGTESTLLLYDFLCPAEVENQIADAVSSLSGTQGWKRIVHVRGEQMDALMRRRYSDSIAGLKALIGESSFDDVFLARDHVGNGSALLLNAYPEARKHSYGDSFGLVGQHEAMARLEGPRRLRDRLRSLGRRLLLGGPAAIAFDDAVLSLPIDLSGKYLRHTPLVVPSHAHVVQTVEAIYAQLPELRDYCDELRIRSAGRKSPLYLLSNLAGSGLSTVDQEVALYLEVIRSHSRPGETLFIKPHPRSSFEFLQAIREPLQADHDVVVIDDSRFARMPIELWMGLLSHCNLVAMFSTSCINLKYLYGKEVVLPLDDDRMRRYLHVSATEHVASGYRMMKQALLNLDRWDGASPLWSAS